LTPSLIRRGLDLPIHTCVYLLYNYETIQHRRYETEIWIEVDQHSGVPIYVQIVDRVRRAVGAGVMGAGDRLPTVRRLAEELTVAPNTVVKAYNELQRMGLIESKAGVGTVISAGVEEVAREQQVEALFGRLDELVRDAASLGVDEDDLRDRMKTGFEQVARRKRGAA
jgi:GntR family transcriptional regulator